ncbi:vWA domain-containing protein [Natrinema salaciae]|uniref:von Willebrand factor type A domain-containing protein n=1 Tax=Natrinema salaciae TaxID=1186196 RepID=A0A1H9MSA2_9EURY|nr:vWA domain-containing protein [Natrinema salaciae]SER26600.1 von Willebrand factor type A domain-containing protein [Natrinema salaciae]
MGERNGGDGSTARTQDRAASPIVGIVLLFGFVIVGALLVFVAGSAMFDALESQAHGEQSEQTLKQFDKDLTTAGIQNDTSGSVYFDEQTENKIVSDGELRVTVSDGYVSNTSRPIELRTLVTTDGGGNEFAYQAGGIWRVNDDRATAVSDPDLRYYTESVNDEQVGRVDISPVTVDGTVGTGEHAIQQASSETFHSFGKDIEYVNYVTVEVSDTAYHHGWYDFLKDEFNATDESEVSADCTSPGNVDENVICHDEAGETVTVVATVDGQTPLANLVDIEPTVYGGLYLEGTSDSLDSTLEVNGYDDNVIGTNETEDLFLANYNTYKLENNAEVTGIPVVNGELGSRGNPDISAIGYGLTVNPVHNRGPFDANNSAYWLGASVNDRDALATELSSSYSDIADINGEIDDVRTNYLDGNPTASGTVTAGMYDGAGSIGTVDSSDGNVHIGVDGNLNLAGVTVKGDNQTSIYVDGNVELSDVEIQPDDRANALWVYASNDSTITINDDFQGVVYAPGADIEIADGTTIDGAIVAGNDVGIGDNVEINFDRSLRSDTPLSPADENKMFEYGETRPPLDATFVLDRSGSMGPHKSVIDRERIEGDDWEPIPVDQPFRNENYGLDIEVRNTTTGDVKRLGSNDYADPDNWQEIRVIEHCGWYYCYDTTTIEVYQHPGNDPGRVRVDATRDFINLMNESNGDRAGVYEFNGRGNVLHHLDSDLNATKADVVGRANGGTSMGHGLKEALDDYRVNGKSGQERIAVLLSDGQNNRGGDSYMDTQVREAKDLNVTLYTVGLVGPRDSSIPEGKLENWAQDTGGEFYKAENSTALREIFETIAKDEVQVDQNIQMGISVTNERETTSGYAISVSEQTVEISD